MQVSHLHAHDFWVNYVCMDGIAIVVLCDCSSSAMNQKKNERNVRETPPSHVDNDFSHFLFSTAFHINDALLSSCMLTITSLDDFSM